MNLITSIRPQDAGVGDTRAIAAQRWSALIGGSALILLGVSRRSGYGMAMAAAGGALAYAAARGDNLPAVLVSQSSVLVNCSPQEAYQFWRNFENLPIFMRHLEAVQVSSEGHSTWIAIGPMGTRIAWDAQITYERPGELIEWNSLPGSSIRVDGSVEFQPAPANRGTIIRAMMRYRIPAGATGRALAKIIGKYPNFLMRQDLRRLKALIETGEIATTEGQTHGPRSTTVAVLRLADPDRPIRREANFTEIFNALRRIA